MSESHRSRDMSVSTGRSPTPIPRHQRSESTTRDSAEDYPPSTFGEDSEGRHSPHLEVHRVHDDRPVAGASPTVPVPTLSQPRSAEHPVSVPVPTHPTSAEHRESVHVPREATATPLDLGTADGDHRRLEDLNEVAEQLHPTFIVARDVQERREAEFLVQEDRREDELRRHKGDRQYYFEEGEESDAEAQQRSDGIWQELETGLKALPVADADEISSIRDMAQQAASLHAKDVLETVRLEREDAGNEREALAKEHARLMTIISEKDARNTALEDELTRARAELDAEKQRVTEDPEMRERKELIQRDENIRGQLGDITNLVQDQRAMSETNKALMEARWEEKRNRREDKNAQMIELRDMIQTIHDNMDRDRSRYEDERRESQDTFQKIIDELRVENAQQRELLSALSEGWRADCERHHQETLEAVRSIANERVSFNVQGYLDDFSRALATEVRMLLGEVGRICEERRALQHEIGELFYMKSKYGPGGEFEPGWTPPGPPPAGPQPPLDTVPPIPDPTGPSIIRPAWQARHPQTRKTKKQPKAAPVPAQVTSWSTWHPDPDAVLTPPSVEPMVLPDRSSPGLFGPTTASSSIFAGPSHMGLAHMDRHLRQVASWTTWHPDPDTVLTPPSVEPTLIVPDPPSPGLFGPRSPSSSIYDEPGTNRDKT